MVYFPFIPLTYSSDLEVLELDKYVDHKNTRCFKCGTNKTYIDKRRNGPVWQTSKITGKLLCVKCYNDEQRNNINKMRRNWRLRLKIFATFNNTRS